MHGRSSNVVPVALELRRLVYKLISPLFFCCFDVRLSQSFFSWAALFFIAVLGVFLIVAALLLPPYL